jgi:CheY-like chemotaxis protein
MDEPNVVLKNVRVLVAEDIHLNQLLMKTLLDDFGFEYDIAENGKVVIEKLRSKSYSVILMDLQMPEMNGFEATDYIRNILKSDIQIIALTADVTTIDLEKCKAVGMNDYISKPVDERLLYNKIVAAVRKSLIIEEFESAVCEEKLMLKCTNLNYLNGRTKSNPKLMAEMISLYLGQTPNLIASIKLSLNDQDWKSLYSSVHKLIPSFSIMGIHQNYENMAKAIQEYASSRERTDGILDMVLQLEEVCDKACKELEEELIKIKNKNNA